MFCTKCGQQLPDGVAFCIHCGAPVGGTPQTSDPVADMTTQLPVSPSNGSADTTQAQAFVWDAQQEASAQPDATQAQPNMYAAQQAAVPGTVGQQAAGMNGVAYQQPVKKKNPALTVIGVLLALAIVAGGAYSAIALFHPFGLGETEEQSTTTKTSTKDSEKSSSDTKESSKTDEKKSEKTDDEKTDEKTDDKSAEESAGETNDASTKDASGAAAQEKAAQQDPLAVQQQTAVSFAKTYWTNVTPTGSDGSGYEYISNWKELVCAYVDPSCNLYAEMQNGEHAGFLDAEDSCVDAVATENVSGQTTMTVYVAGRRQNPVAGWATQTTHTYTMVVTFNGSGQVNGFTSYYYDSSTGKTYSASH